MPKHIVGRLEIDDSVTDRMGGGSVVGDLGADPEPYAPANLPPLPGGGAR